MKLGIIFLFSENKEKLIKNMGVKASKKPLIYHCPICQKDITLKKNTEITAHVNQCRLRINNSNNNRDVLLRLLSDLRIANNEINQFQRELNEGTKEVDDGIIPSPTGTFEQKVKFLHLELKKVKVDWRKGADMITIDRENIVKESITEFAKINPFKELKITFKGEVCQDAGGLIREWLTVLFKTFLDENYNLFEKADTDDFSYLIKQNFQGSFDKLDQYYFIGQILGKALLENLTVNCCLNKLVYKIILEENAVLEDMVFIDKPLYHSLKELKKLEDQLSELSLFFNIEQKNEQNQIITQELIPDGANIPVTKENLDLYISKRIEFLRSSQVMAVDEIKCGLCSIIDKKLIKIFTSDELALLINGTPFIDLEDWRLNTTYRDYQITDIVILDFWQILEGLSQEELSKFLQFCTGSSRVPIGGFGVLESNRGNISKFCITKVGYNPKSINYIKAHTCFNRLDLPSYPNKDLLQNAIQFILNNETLGFGIE